jgi:hypothetical protein
MSVEQMERRMNLQGGRAEVAVKGGENRKLQLVGYVVRIVIIAVILIGTSFLPSSQLYK